MSEWISAKKELPKFGIRVLTLDNFGHVQDRLLRKFADGTLLFSPDGLAPVRHITHWMPLPKSPKEEPHE